MSIESNGDKSMTLKLNGSTSGSVSIDAPASTTGGADIALTLPTKGFGQILQVTSKQDAASYSTTGNTFYQGPETDSLSLVSSDSKVLVTANFMLYMDARSSGYLSIAAALYRGNIASGTQITGGSQPMHYRNSGNLKEHVGEFGGHPATFP